MQKSQKTTSNAGGAIGSAGLNVATVEEREELGIVDDSICSYRIDHKLSGEQPTSTWLDFT